MKEEKIVILGLIGILVLIVAASGCTSSDKYENIKNATFNDGIISFKYPETWNLSNYTTKNSSTQYSGKWYDYHKNTVSLEKDGVMILIHRYNGFEGDI